MLHLAFSRTKAFSQKRLYCCTKQTFCTACFCVWLCRGNFWPRYIIIIFQKHAVLSVCLRMNLYRQISSGCALIKSSTVHAYSDFFTSNKTGSCVCMLILFYFYGVFLENMHFTCHVVMTAFYIVNYKYWTCTLFRPLTWTVKIFCYHQ